MSETCEVVAYVRSERVVVAAREVRGVVPVAATLAEPAYATRRGFAVDMAGGCRGSMRPP